MPNRHSPMMAMILCRRFVAASSASSAQRALNPQRKTANTMARNIGRNSRSKGQLTKTPSRSGALIPATGRFLIQAPLVSALLARNSRIVLRIWRTGKVRRACHWLEQRHAICRHADHFRLPRCFSRASSLDKTVPHLSPLRKRIQPRICKYQVSQLTLLAPFRARATLPPGPGRQARQARSPAPAGSPQVPLREGRAG